MNTIITPNTAIFKEGEVYVYTLQEEQEFYVNQGDESGYFDQQSYDEAVSYARAHPFKVHEKDVKSICMKLYREYSIVPVKDNMMTIGDKVAKDLTEYKIKGLKFELESQCQSGCKINDVVKCHDLGCQEKIACLIEDDGVKEETLPYLAEWIHINGWVWNFGNNKWCQFSENGNQISKSTEELANEWYKIQQKQKL